ncbi:MULTISPECIES: phosphate-starvation-inducible protein PsiE [unclassified Lactococcus]|uniref:phosphate-starvation-inducible protein PsiE n=1 Tax=unclassified Lactococcus TaxID=2643510 RepID=UPI0011C9D961|nr:MULTISPECIES: phosphate-starvation-inducible protein PsiE [unclassified Lactococcus]MQW23382.1 phosphate-starvation-inducible protein PsiE [Lactococcus sp. dk101]TXK37917.1 phosphate-starvation-inducible protein PsiE [Lactococcus sp. dk310]TXK49571.1 phosphate-starvation-inducible protein PsiE [Lactococcus sp. dk322]
MNKLLNKFESKTLIFLEKLSFLALILVGLLIAFFIFREIFNMFMLVFKAETPTQYYKILDSVLSFFIFFEFLTLIITSIKHKGHVSLIFLLSLGVTALIRVVLTYHDNLIGTLAVSASILILIVGIVILKRFIFPDEPSDEHL